MKVGKISSIYREGTYANIKRVTDIFNYTIPKNVLSLIRTIISRNQIALGLYVFANK